MASVEVNLSKPSCFIKKLWNVVEDSTSNDVIAWSDSGASFIIKDQTRFLNELLPQLLKPSNMVNFIQELNMYGFKVINYGKLGLRNKNEEMEFQHSFFCKGQILLLAHIKRKSSSTLVKKSENISSRSNNTKSTSGTSGKTTNQMPVPTTSQKSLALPKPLQMPVPTTSQKSLALPKPLQMPVPTTSQKSLALPKPLQMPVPTTSQKSLALPKPLQMPVPTTSQKSLALPKPLQMPVPTTSQKSLALPKPLQMPVPTTSQKSLALPKPLQIPVSTTSQKSLALPKPLQNAKSISEPNIDILTHLSAIKEKQKDTEKAYNEMKQSNYLLRRELGTMMDKYAEQQKTLKKLSLVFQRMFPGHTQNILQAISATTPERVNEGKVVEESGSRVMTTISQAPEVSNNLPPVVKKTAANPTISSKISKDSCTTNSGGSSAPASGAAYGGYGGDQYGSSQPQCSYEKRSSASLYTAGTSSEKCSLKNNEWEYDYNQRLQEHSNLDDDEADPEVDEDADPEVDDADPEVDDAAAADDASVETFTQARRRQSVTLEASPGQQPIYFSGYVSRPGYFICTNPECGIENRVGQHFPFFYSVCGAVWRPFIR